MVDQVLSKMVQVLLKQQKALGSWNALADAIRRVNGSRSEHTIDRRTLQRICDDQLYATARLNVGQLITLDRYSVACEHGPLLARNESLLDAILESVDLNFVVGARYIEEFHDEAVARWDLGAVTRLLKTPINRLRVRIFDVASDAHWHSQQEQTKNAANIFVASPVSNPASDAAQCVMVGIDPNSDCSVEELPFGMIAAEDDTKEFRGNFVRSRDEVATLIPHIDRVLKPDRRGFFIDETLYASTQISSFALLLAQRDRVSGQVQSVLCGLSGPGTDYLARILESGGPQVHLPQTDEDDPHPPILIAAYRLEMAPEKSEQGRGRVTRRVANARLVFGPGLMKFEKGAWQLPKLKDVKPAGRIHGDP